MKEKYLLGIRNAMLWHFSSSEIRDTIEDINMHFESAVGDGISEEEAVKQWEAPKEFVDTLRGKPDAIERKRRKAVNCKRLLLIMGIFFTLLMVRVCPASVSFCILAVMSSVFIWYLAGNHYILGIIPMTKEKKTVYWKNQAVLLGFYLLIQFCIWAVVPYIAKNELVPLHLLGGKYITNIVFCGFVFFLFMAVYDIIKMLSGNIYMFFCAVQSIGLICGLFSYYNYLKQLQSVEELHFVVFPYLICIPVSWVYLLYFKKRDRGSRSGCTN